MTDIGTHLHDSGTTTSVRRQSTYCTPPPVEQLTTQTKLSKQSQRILKKLTEKHALHLFELLSAQVN